MRGIERSRTEAQNSITIHLLGRVDQSEHEIAFLKSCASNASNLYSHRVDGRGGINSQTRLTADGAVTRNGKTASLERMPQFEL